MAETGKPTTIHLDPDVRAQLDAYRKRTRQSLSAAVNYLVERALSAESHPVRHDPAADLHTR